MKELPANDRASLLEPLHSSFRESQLQGQSCSRSFPHHIGALHDLTVTMCKREADPGELRKEADDLFAKHISVMHEIEP